MSGKARSTLERWELPFLLLLLAAGAALRLAFLKEFSASPFFDYPTIDSLEYLMWARDIQGGNFLWDQVHIHSPLYPYFLAALLSISGESLSFVRTVQAILVGLGNCVILWGIARRCGGPVAGAISVAIAATLWPAVYHDGEILVESMTVLFNGAALLVLIYGRGRPSRLALAGFLLGLSIATRPNAAAFVPLAALWSAWPSAAEHSLGRAAWRRAALRFVVVCLGAGLVAGPLLARNHAISGTWVFQANTWLVFYEGNNPEADGTANMRPGRSWQLFATMAEREGITSLEGKEKYYRERAFRWWREAPADALKLFAKKVFLFWNAYETRSSMNIYYFRALSPTLSLPWPGFGLLAPLALVGLTATALRRRRETDLLIIYTLTYTLATAAFIVGGRYRIPVTASAIPLAGIGVARLIEAFRDGRWRFAAAGAALAVVIGLGVRHVPEDVRINEFSDELYNRGTILMSLGRYAEAEAAFREGWKQGPEDGRIPGNLGVVLLKTGRVADSYRYFREAVRLYPESAESWSNLGVAAAETGGVEEARRAYERSLALAPEIGTTHRAYGLFLLRQGDRDGARAHFLRARALGVDLPPAVHALVAVP